MVRVFLVEEAHLAPIQIAAHALSVRQRALLTIPDDLLLLHCPTADARDLRYTQRSNTFGYSLLGSGHWK